MSRQCTLTGKRVQFGNNVSHAQNKNKRRFEANLQKVRLYSEALNQYFNIKIAARTIRSIDHNGGLDNFLVTAKAKNLTDEAVKIRRLVKKKLAANKADKK